jgi:hypothetical protein
VSFLEIAKQAGANAAVHKPFRPAELLASLKPAASSAVIESE